MIMNLLYEKQKPTVFSFATFINIKKLIKGLDKILLNNKGFDKNNTTKLNTYTKY